MRTVVVQSHPLTDSYNAALLASVCAGLDRAGTPFNVFRIAQGEWPERSDLALAERLVLIYPTWWGGQPASLLAWLREVVDANDRFAGVRELVAVTTCGSSRLINTVQGEWGRRYLQRRVLGLCAPDASFAWIALYKIDRQVPEAVAEFARQLEERFTKR